MFRTLGLVALVGMMLVGLVACGDDDDDAEETPTATAPAGTETATPGNGDPTNTPDDDPTATPDEGSLPEFEDPGTVANDESLEPEGIPQVVDVRIGRNEGFDRIVFEFEEDELPPWEVQYVTQPTACGSGKQVLVGGSAALQINMFIAQAHTPQGEPTIDSNDIVVEFPAMVQGVQTCDFEALVTWVVGTEGALPFRVFALEEPARLVVDVEHP